MKKNVAILYQKNKPPAIDGIIKPMKEGGYSDSGADIAYALKNSNINIITPTEYPDLENNFDWVFPDTNEGIKEAINRGANVVWLNTVLYKGHPIENFKNKELWIVGQIPESVDIYDDKWYTNNLLRENGLPIPKAKIITNDSLENQLKHKLPYSCKTNTRKRKPRCFTCKRY